GARAHVVAELEALLAGLQQSLNSGDHALLMSNGGFGGLHTRLLEALGQRKPAGAPLSRGSA
ncbi:MAG: UDP-N-acetylmuramate:L-alanyl-gamma-D-glutamyl-meso-diaminopimelate ligase, partial [Steroidobacteraceae bacterium]